MSHDRGCFKCHEDPPYGNCQRAECPKRACCDNPKYEIVDGLNTCTCEKPGCPRRRLPETRPTCDVCGRSSPDWGSCTRPPTECPARAAYQPNRLDTRIISVREPGYEIVVFFKPDGSAQAIISRPGDKEPTDFLIAPPLPGRCIVVERKGTAFDVVYRSVP